MAVEQEELRLLVNVIDNASAPLKDIGERLKDIGGPEAKRAHEAARKEINELSLLVKRLSGDLGEAVKHLGGFRINLVQGAAGLVLFGWELAKQLKELKTYSDYLRDLRERAREIGADPAHMKNMIDQLKAAGVESKTAEDAISNLVKSVSELQRAGVGIGSPIYTRLMQMAQTPEAKQHMGALINALIKGETEEIAERTVAAAEAVRKNAEDAYRKSIRDKGREPGKEEVLRAGADATRQFYGQLNLSAADARALERVQHYTRLTEEQAAAENKRNDEAIKFGQAIDRNIAKAEKLREILTQQLYGPLTTLLKGLEVFLDAATKNAEAAQERGEAGEQSKSKIFPGTGTHGPPLSKERRDFDKTLQDLLKRQNDQAVPLIEKQEKHSELIQESTTQLTKLVNLLEPFDAMRRQAAAGGGVMTAAYTEGVPRPPMPGAPPPPRPHFGGGGYRELPDSGATASTGDGRRPITDEEVSRALASDGPRAGNLPGGGQTAEQAGISPEFPVAPNVNWRGLNAEYLARLNAAYRAAPEHVKEKFVLQSGYRPTTRAEARALGMPESSSQEDIWERSGHGTRFAAAPPGRSRHQRGEAGDFYAAGGDYTAADWLRQHPEFGVTGIGASYDRPHIQMAPGGVSRLDEARRRLAQSRKIAVNGTAKVDIDVNGPFQTAVRPESFDDEGGRQHQMVPARGGADPAPTFKERWPQ